MPIYEYACKNCEHTLDALQKISDDALLECPACGQPQLKRLISAPRFRLKGSGWYETDFKKDKQRNLSKGDGEAATSAKSAKSESSDSSSGGDKSGGDKSGGDKSGGDKSGGDKSGGDKSGGEKSGGDKAVVEKSTAKAAEKSGDSRASASKTTESKSE
jgi:putative FmdB family regulatory protein